MSILKIKRLHPQAQLPARATDGSAGHDLYACIEQPTEILPGQTVKVPTGLAIQLESRKYVALIFARSSMGTKYGVIPANAVGVIDSDYRGEVCVCLHNHSDKPYVVQPQDRIAQLLVMPVELPDIEEVDELEETGRGSGRLWLDRKVNHASRQEERKKEDETGAGIPVPAQTGVVGVDTKGFYRAGKQCRRGDPAGSNTV